MVWQTVRMPTRREFLGSTMAASLAGGGVSIVLEWAEGPARWAAGELKAALEARRVPTRICQRRGEAGAADFVVVTTKLSGGPAEALEFRRLANGIEAAGADARGLTYALLELADRVRCGGTVAEQPAVAERPANRIRSVARCFVSDVEDTGWFHDRAMWREYLTMLAAQRFNRFSFTTGIGYDFPRQIRDCYFHFPYPFLVRVPGYDVRVTGVSDAERERNLATLRFIGEETAGRGLDFQLGIWTHAYRWEDSPAANHIIEGLTPETHAAYCRDALRLLLEHCPSITGLTFRVHGESGVAEGSYGFWKTLFDGILRSGRRIEIDMHAKGIDRRMIDLALATGLPVNVSPKFWAEHMGLPYHQAGIRELEMPPRGRQDQGFFALSGGSRRFMRYGYGDLLREDRRYGVLHRIWPGTQRLLLWGDPKSAAAYARAFTFCGSAGVEICEPLSFKGRKGSGLPGGRCAYADASLAPRFDWQKYLYTYRLWGRHLYSPQLDPDVWRRWTRQQFGAGAGAMETALGRASRVLPLITTAHGPSAANNSYWPEMYVNMPIVDAARKHPYSDTPSPKRFGTVSPFDPELFSRVDDFVAEFLAGRRSCKYSPVEVAQWLEGLAGAAPEGHAAESRRWAADMAIQSGLGRFFAHKLRAAALWALFDRTQDRAALEEALRQYRAGRAAWAELAAKASVYRSDVTFGYDRHLRGHWADRLPAIDADISDMERRLESARPGDPARVRALLAVPKRRAGCEHRPPSRFQPGKPLELELKCTAPARLHYRRVNQAETWQVTEKPFVIPAAYTASAYPLQYYFEIQEQTPWVYPGLGPELTAQPYFIATR